MSACILVAGTSAYASGAVSALFPDSKDQVHAVKVETRLNQSWDKGMELLQGSTQTMAFTNSNDDKGRDLSDWTFSDITKLEELTSSFSNKGKSSFLEVYYGEERTKNHVNGDWMPAFLVSPDKTQAICYWEKADGSYVSLEMRADENDIWHAEKVEELSSK